MRDEAARLLLDAQNSDGGWGSAKGRRSNTESTSLAIMALRSLDAGGVETSLPRGIEWVVERQNPDGSWPLNGVVHGGSWTTALALLALANLAGQEERTLRAAKWALAQEGSRFGWLASLWLTLSGQRSALHLNPDLKGWAWAPGAFSWVEPTSYFLLGLKKLRASLAGKDAEHRIRHAEMLIYDRMCEGGGWNYGNSRVLGETLWPYPDVTAVALIALQDHRGIEPINRSLAVLQKLLQDARSGFALSWGIICLSLYGHNVSRLRHKLSEVFGDSRFLLETNTLALSLLASTEGHRLFRI